MAKIWSSFSRRKRRLEREVAPHLNLAQRMSLEQPGVPPNGLSYSVYEQMQQDAMVQTSLTLKKLGAMAPEFKIETDSGSDEGKRRTDFVLENFEHMNGSPHTILHQAMDAFAKGWSVQELIWEERDGKIWLSEVKAKDPSVFGIEADGYGNVQSLRLQVPGETQREVPSSKFVIYSNRSNYLLPNGKSDLDAAYLHWKNKQSLLGAWKLHLERFASPTVLGKFARGLPATDQTSILGQLRQLHQNTAIVFPEEVSIDTLRSNGEGTTAFLEAIDYHNREIARAILGQTLTTDEGRRVGSLALGKVHLQVL